MFIFIESLEECEVQTNLRIWTEPLTIEFKEDSLSYMEKLWLKKHRRYFLIFCIISKKCKSYLRSVCDMLFCSTVIFALHICINNFKAILNPCEASTVLIRILILFMYVMCDWFRVCLEKWKCVCGKQGTNMV